MAWLILGDLIFKQGLSPSLLKKGAAEPLLSKRRTLPMKLLHEKKAMDKNRIYSIAEKA